MRSLTKLKCFQMGVQVCYILSIRVEGVIWSPENTNDNERK